MPRPYHSVPYHTVPYRTVPYFDATRYSTLARQSLNRTVRQFSYVPYVTAPLILLHFGKCYGIAGNNAALVDKHSGTHSGWKWRQMAMAHGAATPQGYIYRRDIIFNHNFIIPSIRVYTFTGLYLISFPPSGLYLHGSIPDFLPPFGYIPSRVYTLFPSPFGSIPSRVYTLTTSWWSNF